jgi:hypothetical protein
MRGVLPPLLNGTSSFMAINKENFRDSFTSHVYLPRVILQGVKIGVGFIQRFSFHESLRH